VTNCSLVFLDSQNQSFQNITIINGKVERTGFSGRIFTYEVTPLAAGAFAAGPVRLEDGSRPVVARGPVIDVLGIEKQEAVAISITSSRDTVLVDEPFDITLTVAIRRLDGNYVDFDPLTPPIHRI